MSRLVSFVFALSMVPLAQAETLPEKLQVLLTEHNLMQSAQENLKAAESKVAVERSGWYPTLAVTGSVGRDEYTRENAADSDLDTHAVTLSLSQKLWDFGALNAAIDSTEKSRDQADVELDRQRQFLLLAGLEAEQKIRTSIAVLNYAKDSEANIKKQTQLESTRIEMGRGYTTDLLQAKSQLAAAEARRVSAEGSLAEAQHRYKSLFGDEMLMPTTTDLLPVPMADLPASLESALEVATKQQVDLRASQAELNVARAEINRTRKAEYMPSVDLVASYTDEENPDGSELQREIAKIAVNAKWDFNLGGQSNQAVSVAMHRANAIERQYRNQRNQVIEDTRNTWTQLKTAERRAAYLENQVAIVERFLELARKERELGKRSLLDVLSGETSLINARSDATVARSEVVLAQLRLLLQVGKLNLSSFQ